MSLMWSVASTERDARPRRGGFNVMGHACSHFGAAHMQDVDDLNSMVGRSAIDAEIADLAESIRANELDERSGRVLIYSKLMAAGIAQSVAQSPCSVPEWQRVDLADLLNDVILERTLESDEGGFDLDRARHASAEGWARQLARSAVQSCLRRLAADRQRKVDVNPVVDERIPMSEAVAAYHRHESTDVLPEEADFEASVESAHDEFILSAKGLQSASRLKLAAGALAEAYKVPMPVRPADLLDRLWVTERVTKDPMLARDSARAFHQLVSDRMSPEQQEIDERLLALWDDYTLDAIEQIIERDARIAQTLVLATLASNPRPHRDSVAGTMSVMRMASTTTLSWIRLCRALLEGWLATECELVSTKNTRLTADRLAELEAAQIAAAADWPAAIAEVIAMPDAPFGSTEQQVKEWIASAVDSFQIARAS